MPNNQFEQREKVELAMIRAEHQKKFQLMIDFIKERVGDGDEYANSVARMVVSKSGVYCELVDLPQEFVGAASQEASLTFVTENKAIEVLAYAAEMLSPINLNNVRQMTILALYTRRGLVDRQNCFIVDYTFDPVRSGRPRIIGEFRPGVMPLYYKIKLDLRQADTDDKNYDEPILQLCLNTSGELYPLAAIKYRGENVTDLTADALSRTVQ